LFRVARAITRDSDRAADAVQEGFANAIRSRHTYREEGPLEAWVWRAVVNAAKKSRRPTAQRQDVRDLREQSVHVEGYELAPLITSLPERQRLAVFLRYYADLDYRSIAETLGIEVGTVSATLATAHRALRRAIQGVTSSVGD